MLNKYAQSALKAAQLLKDLEISLEDAWFQATTEFYVEGTSAQEKGCPKYAFLGLCEEGLIRGVPCGRYILKPNNKNKVYAIQAVVFLKASPELAEDKNELWKKVIKGVKQQHNFQMDVVLALWDNDLIVKYG
jgi:hypothetical protein